MKQTDGMIKCRPCGANFLLAGGFSLFMFFLSLLAVQEFETTNEVIGWLCFDSFWLVTGMGFIFWSIKWDTPVYIGSEGMLQKRKKEMIYIPYKDIREAKIVRFSWDRVHGYMLKVFTDQGTIRIKVGLKCYETFMKYCSNEELIQSIKKQWKDRGFWS